MMPSTALVMTISVARRCDRIATARRAMRERGCLATLLPSDQGLASRARTFVGWTRLELAACTSTSCQTFFLVK